jgi:hypothetical protein
MPRKALRRPSQARKGAKVSEITPALETRASGRHKAQHEVSKTAMKEKIILNKKSVVNEQRATDEQRTVDEKSMVWHPLPVRLVDVVMPCLRDTELRVLLLVLRQTWGWRIAGGWKADRTHNGDTPSSSRQPADKPSMSYKPPTNYKSPTKRRDWLSHTQLCRRTGRSSEAVSAAVAALTASGLIIVEDAGGKALLTPEERRRCLGRLYFRPGAMWSKENSQAEIRQDESWQDESWQDEEG